MSYVKGSSYNLLIGVITLGLLLINAIFLSLVMLGGHSEIGIIGFFGFFPTYLILGAILPASSALNGPEINFSVVLFVTQFLIMEVIALTVLALKKRLAVKRARIPEQRK